MYNNTNYHTITHGLTFNPLHSSLRASFLANSTNLLDHMVTVVELIIPIPTSTNNPSQKSVVLESNISLIEWTKIEKN